VDQLNYIFECRLKLRDENSSLDFKTFDQAVSNKLDWVQGGFKKFLENKKAQNALFVL